MSKRHELLKYRYPQPTTVELERVAKIITDSFQVQGGGVTLPRSDANMVLELTHIHRRIGGYRLPQNCDAWAIGHVVARSGRFKVRKVVWGRLLARAEKRKDEEIRQAVMWVKPK